MNTRRVAAKDWYTVTKVSSDIRLISEMHITPFLPL